VERDDIDDANNIAVVVDIIGADDADAGRHHQDRHHPQRGMGEAGAPCDGGRNDRGKHTQRQRQLDRAGHLLRPYIIDDNNDASDAVDIATSMVTVNNVAPTVSFSTDSPRDEGALLTISGLVSDPGWLNSLTATVNWGDGLPTEAIVGILENVRPDATLSESAHVPPIQRISSVQLSLHAGTQNVKVQTNRALDPGSYKNLHVQTGATLTLRAGRYTLNQLVVEPQATLAVDLSAGPLVIDVAGDVTLKERTQMTIISPTGGAADILFRIGGQSVQLGEDGIYLGTFMALKAMAKLGQNAMLTGALYGKDVEVRERTHIVGQPAVHVFASLLLE
ncbi:MAG: hypothetical protein ACJ8CR_15820, partial [Roseiflexaceae bacterium]